ncbi:hypothetical protein PoB_006016100 [Plakobranchus ocellatus]|uniref:Immunoglobulin domain-containing protein n=1 Tax=Plakobranchus ocellatus TaxID=259542 RepID=A0AAV4CP47_9GAST|nr:hypothetical protein PoB_006016100 [Plakobranchus ocellatus]
MSNLIRLSKCTLLLVVLLRNPESVQPTAPRCLPDQYQCQAPDNTKCIPFRYLCDNDGDCGSNDDEENCIRAPALNFTLRPALPVYRPGQNVTINCATKESTSLVLSLIRERTGQKLNRDFSKDLAYSMSSLTCLNSGVYVCRGKTGNRLATERINIAVLCPQQVISQWDGPRFINAVVGETVTHKVEIYGHPAPQEMKLFKNYAIDFTNLINSTRHSVTYARSEAPFGLVTLSIANVTEEDFVSYIVEVDNGVGEALKLIFSLKEVFFQESCQTQCPSDERCQKCESCEKADIMYVSVIINVVAVVVIAALFATIIIILRSSQRQTETESDKKASMSDPPEQPAEGISTFPQPPDSGVNLSPTSPAPIEDWGHEYDVAVDEKPSASFYLTVSSPGVELSNIYTNPDGSDPKAAPVQKDKLSNIYTNPDGSDPKAAPVQKDKRRAQVRKGKGIQNGEEIYENIKVQQTR